MFLNKYIFGVALFGNIWFKASSLDQKCVTDSNGNLDTSNVLEQYITTPPNVIKVAKMCNVEGVTAEVCSNGEDVNVVVASLDEILVNSEKQATVYLKLYCSHTPIEQGQEKLETTEVLQDVLTVTVPKSVPPTVFANPREDEVKVIKGLTTEAPQGVSTVEEPKAPKNVPLANQTSSLANQIQITKILQDAADGKYRAERAQDNVYQVKKGAAKVKKTTIKSQASVEKAQKKVAKAFVEKEKAQLRVYRAEKSKAEAQKRIHKAQSQIHSAQKRANQAQHDVDKAMKRAEKAQRRVDIVHKDLY